ARGTALERGRGLVPAGPPRRRRRRAPADDLALRLRCRAPARGDPRLARRAADHAWLLPQPGSRATPLPPARRRRIRSLPGLLRPLNQPAQPRLAAEPHHLEAVRWPIPPSPRPRTPVRSTAH